MRHSVVMVMATRVWEAGSEISSDKAHPKAWPPVPTYRTYVKSYRTVQYYYTGDTTVDFDNTFAGSYFWVLAFLRQF
jgi:hypothetical protein